MKRENNSWIGKKKQRKIRKKEADKRKEIIKGTFWEKFNMKR